MSETPDGQRSPSGAAELALMSRATIILNSSEAGTPAHDLAIAALTMRGAMRCLAHCDWLEANGWTSVPVEWVRAQFGALAEAKLDKEDDQ